MDDRIGAALRRNLPRFPISGPKYNPTQEDYILEAVHLRNQANRLMRLGASVLSRKPA